MLFSISACSSENQEINDGETSSVIASAEESSVEQTSSEEASSEEPIDLTGKVVIAYGDSITAAGTWFGQAESELGVTVINRGTGGQNSTEGKNGLKNVLAENPDILLLSYGMNDSAIDLAKHVPLETYTQNFRDMIEEATEAGVKVVLVIENPIGEEQYYTRHDKALFEPYGGVGAFYLQYVEAVRALGVEYGVVVADLYRAFSDTEDYNDYLEDGVHPNEAGYALYAQALCDALLQVGAGL